MTENVQLFLISFFGVIFIIQLIMSAFFSDVEIDTDIGDMSVGLSLGDIFSLKGIVNFFLGGSITSYNVGLNSITGVLLSILGGLILVIVLGLMYSLLYKLQYERKLDTIGDLVGKTAKITSKKGSFMMIQAEINGSLEEVEARLSDNIIDDSKYKIGDSVTIINNIGGKYIVE